MIYTKTGDKGLTSLYTGERVEKNCLRVQTYGAIDEADSALGIARAFAEELEKQLNQFMEKAVIEFKQKQTGTEQKNA